MGEEGQVLDHEKKKDKNGSAFWKRRKSLGCSFACQLIQPKETGGKRGRLRMSGLTEIPFAFIRRLGGSDARWTMIPLGLVRRLGGSGAKGTEFPIVGVQGLGGVETSNSAGSR